MKHRVIEAYNPNSGGNDYAYDSLVGSTVLTTQGTTTVSQQYCAGACPVKRPQTERHHLPRRQQPAYGHTFTGQKLDGTGLRKSFALQ